MLLPLVALAVLSQTAPAQPVAQKIVLAQAPLSPNESPPEVDDNGADTDDDADSDAPLAGDAPVVSDPKFEIVDPNTPFPTEPPKPRPLNIAAVLVTGAGVASLVASAAFGGMAVSGRDSVLTLYNKYPRTAEDVTRQQQVNQNAAMSALFGGIGLAATAGGLVWLAWRGAGEELPLASIAPLNGGAVVLVGGAL